ncbi:MAG: ATP-binding cassette domain-containing protein [Bacteroidetes bacterium]|nr:ATP-binding cassette domain-containing protein [Bacteroidota bacterium]
MVTFNQVVPQPLEGIYNPQSQIWATELAVPSGHLVEVMSASGKGKSTFLQIIYGIRKDFKGICQVNGKDIRHYSPAEKAELRRTKVSIVFQDLRLFPHLTGWENLQVKNQLTGHKTEAEMRELTERLGVAFLLDKPCGIMSYGQQQRFAIIRALCQPFTLLMLDEPFSHLDRGNIELCCALLQEECKHQQAGLILTTLGESYPLPYDTRLTL